MRDLPSELRPTDEAHITHRRQRPSTRGERDFDGSTEGGVNGDQNES